MTLPSSLSPITSSRVLSALYENGYDRPYYWGELPRSGKTLGRAVMQDDLYTVLGGTGELEFGVSESLESRCRWQYGRRPIGRSANGRANGRESAGC